MVAVVVGEEGVVAEQLEQVLQRIRWVPEEREVEQHSWELEQLRRS